MNSTISAISAFQSYLGSSYGIAVTPIDPSYPVIGADTLSVLMSDASDDYYNPNPAASGDDYEGDEDYEDYEEY